MPLFGASYAKATFTPKHPEKCLNTNGKCDKPLPQMRSSWEMIVANFCDLEENVLQWGSEVVEIPYYSNIDGKSHRYITDFVLLTQNRQGEKEKWLVEVKPLCQVPQLNEFGQIVFPELKKNHEKWTAARKWAKDNGYHFKLITEKELGKLNK